MSLQQQVSRAWGIVKSQGPRWVGERLVLEAQKRFGYEARIYPPHAWQGGEPDSGAWRGALCEEERALSAAELLARWREGPGAAWGRARREPAWQRAHAESLAQPVSWSSNAADELPPASASLPATAAAALRARADDICAGRFTLFSRHQAQLTFPPDWLANPLRGAGSHPPADRHWSRIGMEGIPYGDLKFVWELSRASWAFVLGRAYAATRDERYAEAFWQLWMDWLDHLPPHHSVQWKCGQECALRLIAVSFAVQVCANAAATTPARFARHLEAVAAHAARIARGGWYARLQNNNHSMSEAAGLYTAGVFYPALAEAKAWRALGWRHLDEEAIRLVRDDGTFSQKSHNYHRLMLHDYLWSSSVAEASSSAGDQQERWSATARAHLEAAVGNLEGVVDPISGGAPNFGSNDGALILPLDEAPYTDFRPVLRAATFWRDGVHRADASREEGVLWLFGARALAAPSLPRDPAPPTLALGHGGIYTLRQGESWVFTHAEDLRDRPGQADLLHVDLWWRGCNVARDAGTYLYYGDPAAFAWFKGSRCHNTVTVDGCDQMEPGPRFLWASRAHAQMRVVPAPAGALDGAGAALIASHDGYHRLAHPVTHTRAVRARGKDTWLVADELVPLGSGEGSHDFTLHWLLPDLPATFLELPGGGVPNSCDLALDTPAGPFFVQIICLDGDAPSLELVRAADGPELWGWQSRHYGEKTPALSLRARVRGPRAKFLTLFSPHAPTRPLLAVPWLDDNHLRL